MPAILTHRKNQLGYVPGQPCPNQLIGGIIFCGSAEGRRAWIKRLNERHPSRFNHFVCFVDVQSPYALQFCFAEWQTSEKPYVIW
jgi:hypothetical protein